MSSSTRRQGPQSLEGDTTETGSGSPSSSTAAGRGPRRRDASGRSRGGCGIDIPHLCHRPQPGYRPDGNCRACMVEIEGERVLAASCIRMPPRA